MLLNSSTNVKGKIVPVVLPAIYVLLAFIFLRSLVGFYINGPDPVYPYLLNGLNLARGQMVIGHADHPGTPVQCFIAAVIFIRHLLFGSGPLYEDVLLHPESYLYTISITLILLFGIVTYLSGRYILKHTGNPALVVLFQIIPSCKGVMMDIILPRPETFIIIVGIFFATYLYVHIIKQQKESDRKSDYKTAFITGIFTAFLIACKFTCLFFVPLLLFILSTYKERAVYLITVVVAFFFFIIPTLSNATYMRDWLVRLATHGGHYGFGQEQVLNISEIKTNLIDMFFQTEIVFPFIFGIIFVAFIVALLSYSKNNPDKIYLRVISGIWLSTTLLAFVITKHYSFYYLRPAQMCFPLALAISHNIFLRSGFYAKFYKPAILVLGVAYFVLLMPHNFKRAEEMQRTHSSFLTTREFLKTQKNTPIIVVFNDHESALIEPSYFFGIIYSGYLKHFYFHYIHDLYPNTYIYLYGNGELDSWDEEIVPPVIFSKNSNALVYFVSVEKDDRENILNKICSTENGQKLGNYEKVFSNTDPLVNEVIYKVNADSASAKKLLNDNRTIFCNLENVSPDSAYFISSDGDYKFHNGGALEHEICYSGTTSVKMDKQHPYCMDAIFKVTPGSFVTASIWRKSESFNGDIIFTSTNSGQLYKGGAAIVDTARNGWQKIQANCIIPKDYKDDSLHFYLYCTSKKPVYFDDVTITVYPMNNNSSDSTNLIHP